MLYRTGEKGRCPGTDDEDSREVAERTADVLDALRREYDKDIATLKTEVATLKDEIKSWKTWFNGLALAVAGALILAAIGLKR